MICLVFFSFASHAEISKWIDAEGKVHYSDTPPGNIKAKTIKSTAVSNNTEMPTPASGAPAPQTLAEREAAWKKTQKSKEEAAQKAAKEQEAISAKQKNCEIARNNLATLENSPVIATYNAQGERNIMDDSARKQHTEEARKAVSSYCN